MSSLEKSNTVGEFYSKLASDMETFTNRDVVYLAKGEYFILKFGFSTDIIIDDNMLKFLSSVLKTMFNVVYIHGENIEFLYASTGTLSESEIISRTLQKLFLFSRELRKNRIRTVRCLHSTSQTEIYTYFMFIIHSNSEKSSSTDPKTKFGVLYKHESSGELSELSENINPARINKYISYFFR